MTNPAMPNLPGFGAITESMELVRKMWGGMGSNGAGAPGIGIPGMVMPSLSVEDINKQITDLKAVESWLTLNMNMLRGTIQALEVQSATITTLKTMSENFSAAVKPPADAGSKAATGFTFPFGAAPAAPPAAPRAVAPEIAAAPPEAVAPPEDGAAKAGREKAASAPTPAFAAPVANPAAWWNMLQDQFKQAVNTALTPEAKGKSGAGSDANPSAKAAAKSAAKTAVVKNGAAPAKKPAAKTAAARATKTAPRQR